MKQILFILAILGAYVWWKKKDSDDTAAPVTQPPVMKSGLFASIFGSSVIPGTSGATSKASAKIDWINQNLPANDGGTASGAASGASGTSDGSGSTSGGRQIPTSGMAFSQQTAPKSVFV